MNSKKELFDLLKKTESGKKEYLTDLFRNLPEETAKQMIVTEVKKGDYILQAGMPCDTVYFILNGRVIGEAHQKMGQMYSFMDFSKKDIIGDFEVFTDCSEFCASVRAEQNCKLLKLSKKSYLNWIRHDEHALFLRLRKILNTFSSETNIEREWLFMGCKERLVNYLVRLYEREQSDKPLRRLSKKAWRSKKPKRRLSEKQQNSSRRMKKFVKAHDEILQDPQRYASRRINQGFNVCQHKNNILSFPTHFFK